MISDLLRDAAHSIRRFLEMTGATECYGAPGNPLRDSIDNLATQMESIQQTLDSTRWFEESKLGFQSTVDGSKRLARLPNVRNRFPIAAATMVRAGTIGYPNDVVGPLPEPLSTQPLKPVT